MSLFPRVLNIKTSSLEELENGFNIMRPGKLGNLFKIGRDGNREEVVAKHKNWLAQQPELISFIKENLQGKNLICCCAPKSCHGDIILKIANEGS